MQTRRDQERETYRDDPEPVAADERTGRAPRIVDRDQELVVNVDRAPEYPVVRHVTPATTVAARKAQQAVWYFFGILETLLALRFVLFAVGANPANPFFQFLTDVTDPLVAPFANLVQTPKVGDSVLESGTIFAMVIYMLLAIAIAKLIDLLLTRGDTY
jgi:uncharacterized protein YggT (Ycf19 family)